MNKNIKLMLLALGLCLSTASHADEHIFNYAYTAETLPKGGLEFQQLITNRWDKGQGYFRATEFETELEYGITDRLQISGYLLALDTSHNGAFPAEAVDDGAGGVTAGDPLYPDRNFTGFAGVKTQIKYNILSPYLNDGWGLSFLIEPSYRNRFKVDGSKTKQFEIAVGAQLQKNLLDDQLILAYSTEVAREKRILVEDDNFVEHEVEWYNYLGASYRVAPNWYVGLEARHHMDVLKVPNGDTFKKNQYSFFMGPTVHYTTKQWWATVTYFRQLHGSPTYATEAIGGQNDNLHLDENEKNEIRVRVGFDF